MKCGSEKLHRKLVEHFELNQKLPPSAVEELRSLLHAQSCKNIREPAKNTSVYRGQGFQQIPKQFRSLRGAGWHKVDISLNKVPLSWTQKESVARRYLAHGWPGIIYRARVIDNPGVFLQGKGGLYRLVNVYDQEEDAEVLSIYPVQIEAVRVLEDVGFEENPHELDIGDYGSPAFEDDLTELKRKLLR